MITPILNEKHVDFIKRGLIDESVIDLFPNYRTRVLFLSEMYKKFLKDHPVIPKAKKGDKGDVGEKGDRGEQGEKGEDGKVPVKGQDYFTQEDIKEFEKAVLSEIKIPEAKNITIKKKITPEEREAIINEALNRIDFTLPNINFEPEKIRDALQTLEGNERLDASAIKNLPEPKIVKQYIGGGGGGGSVVQTAKSGTVTRDGNGRIQTIVLVGGSTSTITRDANHYIQTVSDGSRTWTINRDGNNKLTGWIIT